IASRPASSASATARRWRRSSRRPSRRARSAAASGIASVIAITLGRAVAWGRRYLRVSADCPVIAQRGGADFADTLKPHLADVNVGSGRIFGRIAVHDDAEISLVRPIG